MATLSPGEMRDKDKAMCVGRREVSLWALSGKKFVMKPEGLRNTGSNPDPAILGL